MWTALFRKARADMLSQPLQTALVFLVVAAATATFTFALTTAQSVGDAYLDRLAETNGAHVWFRSTDGVSDPSLLAPIADMDGVTASSGPFPVLFGQSTLLTDNRVVDLRVFGIPAERVEVGKPLITDGRWLATNGVREIVLDKGLARELGLTIDENVEVLTGGRIESLKVVGFAVASDQISYPWEGNAFSMVLPETIERLEPDPNRWEWRLSVRIEEPENARQFGREVIATYAVGQHWPANWLDIEEDLTETFKLFATFFGIFGIVSLGAAAFVIVNVVVGFVMAHVRDIGLLKSIGFTPRQVALLLLIEHVGLSLPASALGILLGFAAAPLVLRAGTGGLGTLPPPSLDPLLTVPLAIALITLLPAWRGGRVPPVQALTVGIARVHPKPSKTGRLASRLRTSTVISLGVKDIFARPFRAALTVMALTGAVILATFTVGMDATLRDITKDPGLTGNFSYEVTVNRGPGSTAMPDVDVRDLIESRSEVEAYRPQRHLMVVFNGADGGQDNFGVYAKEGDPALLAFRLTGGRLFSAPGETIISRELADLSGANVGDDITLELLRPMDASRDTRLEGKQLDLLVVGVYIRGEIEAVFDLDTLRIQAQVEIEPTSYAVKLVDGADGEALKAALVRQTSGRLRVEFYDAVEDNRQTAGIIRPPLYGITGAILAIGAVNLLISLFLGVRERYRDFGIMKTVGFTPRQILASVGTSAILFALVAIAIGTPLGLLFTRFSLNYIGEEAGAGSPFGSMPGPAWMVVLALITLVVAIIGALVPARRAAGISVTEALRYE